MGRIIIAPIFDRTVDMAVTKDEFRSCMSVYPTGVTVVTTLDEEGNVHGMSANSFTSVCLEPPLILVCVAHNTNTYGFIEKTGKFGVNVLRQNQEDIGRYFARKPADRTGDVPYTVTISPGLGLPAIGEALVFFSCEVVGSHLYGDHTIYIAEVKELERGDPGTPVLFYESRWYAEVDMS